MGLNISLEFLRLLSGEQQLNNDRGNRHDFRCATWLTAGMMQRPSSFHLKEEEYKIILTYTYDVPTVVPTKNIIEYTVTGDGTIRIQGTYQGVNGLPELPVYGRDFKLKKDLNSLNTLVLDQKKTI